MPAVGPPHGGFCIGFLARATLHTGSGSAGAAIGFAYAVRVVAGVFLVVLTAFTIANP